MLIMVGYKMKIFKFDNIAAVAGFIPKYINFMALGWLGKAYIGYSIIFIILSFITFFVFKFLPGYKRTVFIITLSLLIFIKLAQELLQNNLSIFDSSIYGFLSGFISNRLTLFMKVLSDFGSAPFLIAITLLSYYILNRNRKGYSYGNLIALNLATTWLLNDIFKDIFHRQRPDILRLVSASGFSFPSGHSMTSMSFYGLLIYITWNNIDNKVLKYGASLLLTILILLIGTSRIYLGVHYASDVIAGFSAGLVWLAVVVTVFNKYKRKLEER